MKKIIGSLSERLPPVRLYLEDLENIVELLNEADAHIEIQTQNHSFQDLTDLEKLPVKSLQELKFMTKGLLYISLDFEKRRTFLFILKNTGIQRSVFSKLQEFLISRRRQTFQFGKSWDNQFYTINGVAFILLILYFVLCNIFNLDFLFSSIGGIVIYTVILILALVRDFTNKTVIYLKYKSEMPNFWERNNDQIGLLIISLILTIAITAVVTYLITKN